MPNACTSICCLEYPRETSERTDAENEALHIVITDTASDKVETVVVDVDSAHTVSLYPVAKDIPKITVLPAVFEVATRASLGRGGREPPPLHHPKS